MYYLRAKKDIDDFLDVFKLEVDFTILEMERLLIPIELKSKTKDKKGDATPNTVENQEDQGDDQEEEEQETAEEKWKKKEKEKQDNFMNICYVYRLNSTKVVKYFKFLQKRVKDIEKVVKKHFKLLKKPLVELEKKKFE